MTPIAVGDTIADGNLSFLNEKGSFESVSIYSLITGKKVLIIGFPGAFLPSSSWCVRPEQIERASDPTIEQILYITVNDPYVVREWGKSCPQLVNGPRAKFFTDWKAAYATSLGLGLDLTSHGFGVRCKKFAIILQDRKVDHLSESQTVLAPLPPLLQGQATRAAPIAVGDIIPDGMLTFINQQALIESVSVRSIVTGKKVIVLGLPGAFFVNCSKFVVPSYIRMADVLKSKGVQEILCISVNDPYVVRGWRKVSFSNTTKIKFLADYAAAYVASLGLVADLSRTGVGIRSMMFALLLDDCRVKVVEFRRPGTLDMLLAENMIVAMASAQLRDQLRDACGRRYA